MRVHGQKFRRVISILGAAGLAGALVTTVTSASAVTSQAATTNIGLQGSIAGGIKIIGDQTLTFVFTETNHGTVAVPEILVITKIANTSPVGTACVFPGGTAKDPDGNSCEPVTVKPGQSASYVLSTQVSAGAVSGAAASVQACTYNGNTGAPGPCKTLSAKIA